MMVKELTGRHVLMIALAAFGTIIAVNVVLAVFAVRTFPGLEVKNSYVASQSFDRERAAQEALGWTVVPDYDGKVLTLVLRGRDGLPVRAESLTATVGRTTHMRDDITPPFIYENGAYYVPLDLAPGQWNIHVTAVAADGTVFRQRIDHYHGAMVRAND